MTRAYKSVQEWQSFSETTLLSGNGIKYAVSNPNYLPFIEIGLYIDPGGAHFFTDEVITVSVLDTDCGYHYSASGEERGMLTCSLPAWYYYPRTNPADDPRWVIAYMSLDGQRICMPPDNASIFVSNQTSFYFDITVWYRLYTLGQ